MLFVFLGRLTQRAEPDLVSTWVYNTAAKGIGKLTEAYTGPVGAKTYDRVHGYDSLGRPASLQATLDQDYLSRPATPLPPSTSATQVEAG